MRFLDSLGAKDATVPLQVFMTTHSPVALRELSGSQLFVVRAHAGRHYALPAGSSDEVQSTLRADPEVFLAKSVIVCEGASEVGFARGLDQMWTTLGATSFLAHGGSYANAGGGSPDNSLKRGAALLKLGYRVLVFVDADKPAAEGVMEAFLAVGGEILTWREGLTLEDEIFRSLSETALDALLVKAEEVVGADLMDENIRTRSNGQATLASIRAARLVSGYPRATRELLGSASRIRNKGWFKSLTTYQEMAKNIIGPDLANADPDFRAKVDQLWTFTSAP